MVNDKLLTPASTQTHTTKSGMVFTTKTYQAKTYTPPVAKQSINPNKMLSTNGEDYKIITERFNSVEVEIIVGIGWDWELIKLSATSGVDVDFCFLIRLESRLGMPITTSLSYYHKDDVFYFGDKQAVEIKCYDLREAENFVLRYCRQNKTKPRELHYMHKVINSNGLI